MSKVYSLPGWVIVAGIIAAYKYGRWKTKAQYNESIIRSMPKSERQATHKVEREVEPIEDEVNAVDVEETEEETESEVELETEPDTESATGAEHDRITELIEQLGESLKRIVNNGHDKDEG